MSDSTPISTRPIPETARCWDCDRPIECDGRCDACAIRYDDAYTYEASLDTAS